MEAAMIGIDNKVLVFALSFVLALFFYVYFFVFPLMSKVSDFEFSRVLLFDSSPIPGARYAALVLPGCLRVG